MIKKDFNFCFWAKLIVAIPALPLLGYVAALPFTDPMAKVFIAASAITWAVYLARWIDRRPCLMKKISGVHA